MLVRLLTVNMNCLNPKKSRNMGPHHSYSSREDAKTSSYTSTLASCKEVSPRLVWSKIKNVNDRDEKGAFLFIFALYRIESGGWIFFVRRPKFLSRNGTFLQLNWRYLTSWDWDWAPNGAVVFFCRSDAALPFHYISFRKLAKSASNYLENLCFSFPLCPTKSERDKRHA